MMEQTKNCTTAALFQYTLQQGEACLRSKCFQVALVISGLVLFSGLITFGAIGLFSTQAVLPSWLSHAVTCVGEKLCSVLFTVGVLGGAFVVIKSASLRLIDDSPAIAPQDHNDESSAPKQPGLTKEAEETSPQEELDDEVDESVWKGLPLHDAAYHGDVGKINELLAKPSTLVNTPNPYGQSPLLLAALRGEVAACKALLFRSDVNEGASDFCSLHYAAASNNIELIDLLLSDPRTNINRPSSNHLTPLHYAAQMGSIEAVEKLLHYPKIEDSFSYQDKDGNTPLDIAIAVGHASIIELLLLYAPKLDLSYSLEVATKGNRSELITYLLAHDSGDPGRLGSLLFTAAENGSVEAFAALLEEEDIASHYYDKSGGVMPFEILLSNVPRENIPPSCLLPPLHQAAHSGDVDTLRELLKNPRLDPHEPFNGRSPILCAVASEKLACVEALIVKSTDWWDSDSNGDSALHLAMRSGNIAIIKALLKTDAEPWPNKRDLKPLHLAIINDDSLAIEAYLEYRVVDEYGYEEYLIFAEESGHYEAFKSLYASNKRPTRLYSLPHWTQDKYNQVILNILNGAEAKEPE